jgi:hypothetical protein
MKFEIKNRFTRAVQVTAEIECDESESYSVKLGLAVQWAIKSGANLAGANLVSANLSGANLASANLYGANLASANLGGLTLIARVTRADGYEYFAWTSILGGMVIKAGCRQWVGETAIEKARNHCRTITADKYRQEALDIIDYIEKRYGR